MQPGDFAGWGLVYLSSCRLGGAGVPVFFALDGE